MSRTRTLDERLLKKVARKLNKRDLRDINVLVSKKANKLGISSEAALILMAKEFNISTSTFQKKLDPNKQAEVRDMLPILFEGRPDKLTKKLSKKLEVVKKYSGPNKRLRLKAAIEYLLEDTELQARCTDLLLASSHFDRPINQATLVLEDRIRQMGQPPQRLEGIKLVNFVLSGDSTKTVLKVSSNPDEQEGFTNIIRGVMLAFRNPTHHHVINTFSREQALKVCALIDVLLKVVDQSQKIK